MDCAATFKSAGLTMSDHIMDPMHNLGPLGLDVKASCGDYMYEVLSDVCIAIGEHLTGHVSRL